MTEKVAPKILSIVAEGVSRISFTLMKQFVAT
jgi:hypothetical protein